MREQQGRRQHQRRLISTRDLYRDIRQDLRRDICRDIRLQPVNVRVLQADEVIAQRIPALLRIRRDHSHERLSFSEIIAMMNR